MGRTGDRLRDRQRHRGAVGRLIAPMILTVILALPAAAIVNPHDQSDPDRCRSCHTPEINEVEPGGEEYYLLTDSIDDTCLICHKKEDCCVIGQEHQKKLLIGKNSHPSNIPAGDVARKHLPKTLPLQDDTITCSTCHEHNRRESGDYKLVRMVIVKETGIDWTPLCGDCHEDY